MTRTPHHGRQCPPPPFRPAPALLGVGALLFCACPAGAQTLSVGSGTATVSGTGTAVTGGGTTFGGGAGTGTSSYQSGSVGGPAGPATLNLQSGGSIQAITAQASSTINVSGGTVGTIVDVAGVSSILNHITISGGTLTSVGNDRGTLNITGGTIQNVGSGAPNSEGPITISGGNIQNVATPGDLTINGGVFGTVREGAGPMSGSTGITGGTIQNFTLQGFYGGISGGSFQFITNGGFNSILNITGTGLQEIGTPTDANNDGVFRLMGLLSDGETLNAQYTQTGGIEQLQFNGVKATPSPVPEASTLVSLGGMLLLGGAGLAFRARKRAAA